MKTNLTVDIALDVANERDAERLEDELSTWLMTQQGVEGMRVLHQGDLAGFAWREARRRAFGSPLQNPFTRAAGEH
jgi:hypothetical protein